MQEKKHWTGPDAEYIVPLYRLAISNVSDERIFDWMAINGLRFSNQLVKRTMKMAGREDLLEYLIKEEDIQLGDTVKSRMTARIGEVILIRPDGDSVVVKWETGGRQLVGKESLFKLRSKNKEVKSTDDIIKVNTSKKETYKVPESIS